MYGLSAEDLQIQENTPARSFADELIPLEVTAELNNGELPADAVACEAKRARELGLHAANMPVELGGGGLSSLRQVLVQEHVVPGDQRACLGRRQGPRPARAALAEPATPYQLGSGFRAADHPR